MVSVCIPKFLLDLTQSHKIRPLWTENGTRHPIYQKKWRRFTAVAATVYDHGGTSRGGGGQTSSMQQTQRRRTVSSRKQM